MELPIKAWINNIKYKNPNTNKPKAREKSYVETQ